MRNICFHIEDSLSDLSAMAQGKPFTLSCRLDFQFTLTSHFKVTGDVSLLLINTEIDRVVHYFGKLLSMFISNG